MREYRNGDYSKDGRKRDCNKVILVTHSMGGLVARSACMMYGAKEKVLGVVHGVQPAAGSPAAYWRMKAGFERPGGGPNKSLWDWLRNPLKMAKYKLVGHISAVILGTNGEEVTSLLGNSPGGLELLPTKTYCDNAGNRDWLTYPSAQGEVRLPVSDPYEEIYLLRDFVYRMVDPEWLDPVDEKDKILPGRTNAAWELYVDYLNWAKQFHDDLQNKFHPESYQFYGTDLDSPDRVVFTRQDRLKDKITNQDFITINKGGFHACVDKREMSIASTTEAEAVVSLAPPAGKGDGTVPDSSGKSLQMGSDRTAKIDTKEGSWFEIGHQDIYGTERAQDIVYTCIWNLLQKYIDDELCTKRKKHELHRL